MILEASIASGVAVLTAAALRLVAAPPAKQTAPAHSPRIATGQPSSQHKLPNSSSHSLALRVILDSCVLMDRRQRAMFTALPNALRRRDAQLLLPENQDREITRLKDQNPFGSRLGSQARCAIDRLEKLQIGGLVRALRKRPPSGPEHADKAIVAVALSCVRQQRELIVVSHDKKLRFDTREAVRRAQGQRYVRVLTAREFCHEMSLPYWLPKPHRKHACTEEALQLAG